MIPDDARLLRLHVNGSDRWQGKPLYRAVVELARAMHMAGASVFQVDLSYDARRRLLDARSEYLFVDIPVVVEIVDAPERVAQLLEQLRPMLADGIATVAPVRVVRYAHHHDREGEGEGEGEAPSQTQ
jgi:PII-like signaling protein